MFSSGGGRSNAGDEGESWIQRERRLIRIYFGIGLAGSGILGSIALLVMLTLAAGPGHDRWHWFGAPEQNPGLGLYDALPRPQARAPGSGVANLPVIDVVIPRAERAGAPLRLEHAGAEMRDALSADGFNIVLRNVPVAVTLSRGVREDLHTWRLIKGDLPHLYLVLRKEAPDAFELAVDAGSGKGAVKPVALARVRVVDEAPQALLPAPRVVEPPRVTEPVRKAVATIEAPAAKKVVQPAQAQVVNAGVAVRQPSIRPADAQVTKGTGMAPSPAPKVLPGADAAKGDISRPQGIRGLGGPGSTAIDASADNVWGRQVWWRLPPPSWSPFKEAGVR